MYLQHRKVLLHVTAMEQQISHGTFSLPHELTNARNSLYLRWQATARHQAHPPATRGSPAGLLQSRCLLKHLAYREPLAL